MRLIAILLAFCLAAPAAAQTREERTRLDWVLQRGRLIFELNRAAWVTTDDLRARRGDLDAVRGWTVERDGTGYVVTYFAGEGDARAALYRGRVENNRVVSREVFPADARPSLTAVQRRLADARRAVGLMNQRPCTNAPFNTVVIPPATPDAPAEVYALTAQTEFDFLPVRRPFSRQSFSGRRTFVAARFHPLLPQHAAATARGEPAGGLGGQPSPRSDADRNSCLHVHLGTPARLCPDRRSNLGGDGRPHSPRRHTQLTIEEPSCAYLQP